MEFSAERACKHGDAGRGSCELGSVATLEKELSKLPRFFESLQSATTFLFAVER